MTDTEKLRDIIKESGYKLSYIASCLGITTFGLQKKIDNKNQFKAKEIQAVCDLLKIDSLELKDAIFFANRVDEKSTEKE